LESFSSSAQLIVIFVRYDIDASRPDRQFDSHSSLTTEWRKWDDNCRRLMRMTANKKIVWSSGGTGRCVTRSAVDPHLGIDQECLRSG
jgi:hypothetical protein